MPADENDEFSARRPGPDPVEPPPVPASHPAGKNRIREGLRIPAAFYVEALFSAILLLGLYVLVSAAAPAYLPVFLAAGGVAALGACLVRMVKRIIALRKKGAPPLEATIVFWLAMIVPLGLAAWYVRKTLREIDPVKEKQVEAHRILALAAAAEKDFHKSYGRYTYNVKELGFDPAPGARYVLGFPAACTAKFSVEGAKSSWDLLDFTLTKNRKLEIQEFFRGELAENCPDPKEGYEIFAVGQLRDDGPLDVWKVGAGRKIEHVQEGR